MAENVAVILERQNELLRYGLCQTGKKQSQNRMRYDGMRVSRDSLLNLGDELYFRRPRENVVFPTNALSPNVIGSILAIDITGSSYKIDLLSQHCGKSTIWLTADAVIKISSEGKEIVRMDKIPTWCDIKHHV